VARFVGVQKHGDRLRRLRSFAGRAAVADAVEDGLNVIADIAKNSIIEGAVSGRDHVPSNPGEPPNADTHDLDQSIHVVMNRETLYGKVVATSDHAAAMEYGTSTIEERPYMRPAGQKGRPKARQGVIEAIRRTNRG
jgi:hypothetical protein